MPLLAHLPEGVRQRLDRALAGLSVYLVGGTARTLVFQALNQESPGIILKNRDFRDLDLLAAAPAHDLEDRLRREGFRPVPVGRQFEIVKVNEPGLEIDVAGLPEAARPLESLLRADLQKRDFTLNAIAISWPDGRVVDPTGGEGDIRRGVIRAVGRPADRLAADPLRVLRAARFSAATGFRLDAALSSALADFAPRLANVAPERVRAELLEILGLRYPSLALGILREAGALAVILPELAACAGVSQSRHHALDVFEHTLLVCDLLPPERPILRLAALFHDVGKPPTRRFDATKTDFVFRGHAEVGAEHAAARLSALRFSNDEVRHVRVLVREHMFKFQAALTPRAVRRWLIRLGDVDAIDAVRLALADTQATGLHFAVDPDTRTLVRLIRQVRRARSPLRVNELAVGGDDLIAMGLVPGPAFRRILEALLDLVLEDPRRNEREILLAEARRLVEALGVGVPPR